MKKTHSHCHRMMLFVAGLLFLQPHSLLAPPQAPASSPVLFTWENVGQITQIKGKVFTLRRRLRLSESSWSLEPGAVAKISELEKGNKIFAQGRTMPEGTFDVKRIYRVAFDSQSQPAPRKGGQTHSSDYGGPEGSKPPTVKQQPGAPADKTGTNNPGQPGNGSSGSPGQLQDPRGSRLTRFNSWDADGVIEAVGDSWLELSQSYFADGHTEVVSTDRSKTQFKKLKVGMRVAVTVKDEVDEKNQAIKANVIRILPK